jgi:hypothetical protein
MAPPTMSGHADDTERVIATRPLSASTARRVWVAPIRPQLGAEVLMAGSVALAVGPPTPVAGT